jgi:DNA modification methylase
MAFWNAPLNQTVQNAGRLVLSSSHTNDVGTWLKKYTEAAPTSSNQGVANLPFQRWFRFKEAFSPKFVADTLSSLPYQVETCLDPFAGSGTTALTCRMLGIQSIGVEVNPFLADLIEAKLTPISAAEFSTEYTKLIDNLTITETDKNLLPGMPKTFAEPGVNGRFIFKNDVYQTARAILRLSKAMPSEHARLLRVLLGSILVDNSNACVNGKGRRYRKNWQQRQNTGSDLINNLDIAIDQAIEDISKFAGLPKGNHTLYRGDTRTMLTHVSEADVAIFSPPYPNSFDYTDVYNIELWMLGYLTSAQDSLNLRRDTLRSHVQTKWDLTETKAKSETLISVIKALKYQRPELWNINIPEMVGYYFDDLWLVFHKLSHILKVGRHAVVAIGDSQYAGVHINVATILTELVKELGFRLQNQGTIRSMRSSPQHGGRLELSEHCLVFERVDI